MAFPLPLLAGTFVYIIIGLALGYLASYLRKIKKLSLDEAQICCTTIIVCTFSCWLMWACVWMHQWNPIIIPTITNMEELEMMAGMHGDHSHRLL